MSKPSEANLERRGANSLRGERVWLYGTLALIALLGVLVFVKMVPVAGAADASGYMNFARLLDEGRIFETLRKPESDSLGEVSETLFQPLGFNYNREFEKLSPVYPSGLPLLLATGGIHGSPTAVRGTFALIAMASCLGLWLLAGGLGLSASWRFYSVAMLATAPLFLWSSLVVMSDLLATCLAIWIFVLALRAGKSSSWAIVTGFLLGWAVLTRPTNVLLFLPLAGVLFWNKAPWGTWIWVGLGGSPAAVWFFWTNQTLHGGWLASGYGDYWSLLRFEYLPETLVHYATTLLYAVFVAVMPTSLWAARRIGDPRVLVLIAWAGALLGFYAFYFFTSETWWFLRFVLVAVPALILLSALSLSEIGKRWEGLFGKDGWRLVVGLTVLALVFGAYWTRELRIFREQDFERRYEFEANWATEQLPPETLVVCMQASGALYYYSEFAIFRWDLAKEEDWQRLRKFATTSPQRVVAILHEFEEERSNSPLKLHPSNWLLLGEVSPRIRAFEYQPSN